MEIIELTQFDQVMNIEETGQCAPIGYTSWKDFWKKNTQQHWPDECRISRCTKTAYCGGHVYVDRYDEVYIVPLCRTCNHVSNTNWMFVNTGTLAVLVEEDDTSGPQQICYR